MTERPTVFVVDDDPAVRTSLARSLGERGYRVEAYGSALAFLRSTEGRRSGCLVLDVRMPDLSGLELQELLHRQGRGMPIIFVTGHGDIPMAVRALKGGALDFLEKPYAIETLVRRIEEALVADLNARQAEVFEQAVRARLETLTTREREVFEALTAHRNVSNQDVADSLGISHRTVEVHRSRIMHKLGARTLLDLLDMAAHHRHSRT